MAQGGDFTFDLRGDLQLDADDALRGWCWSPASPQARQTVEIMFDAAVTARVTAGEFRRDLHDQGIGDGRHGFTFRLPRDALRKDGAPGVISARMAHGPVFGRVTLPESGQQGAHGPALDRIAATLVDLSVSLSQRRLAQPGARLRAAFGRAAAAATDPMTAGLATLRRHGPVPRLRRAVPPAATLARLAGGNAAVEWRWLAAMAPLAQSHTVELLLIDPGRDPLVALFPALVDGLLFRRARGAAGLAETLAQAPGGRVLVAGEDGSPAAIGALLDRLDPNELLLPRAAADALGLRDLPALRLAAPSGVALALPAALHGIPPWAALLAAAQARQVGIRVLDEPWRSP